MQVPKPYDYTTSDLYKAGVRAFEWGTLLMNPETDLRQIADFACKWGDTVTAHLLLERRKEMLTPSTEKEAADE